MKKVGALVTVVIAVLSILFGFTDTLDSLTGATVTEEIIEDTDENNKQENQVPKTTFTVQDEGNIQVHFCPSENCSQILSSFIDTATKSVHCALHELDDPSIQNSILQKQQEMEVKIIVDDHYLDEFNYSFVTPDRSGLMHNKFCIIDNKRVSTGSMNPTILGTTKNNNNLLIIESSSLATNYEDEFKEMWNGTWKKGDQVSIPKIQIENTQVETYFCPEDNCADKIKNELEKAQSSIYFMTFSFTHEEIGNIKPTSQ